MDAFSYLSVLLSIVLGLGLTQLLAAAGRLIRHRDRVEFDWLPLLWAAVLLIVYIQVWWAMFGLRSVTDWTFVKFLTVLAQTTTLYLMAAVILPEQIDEAGIDLGAYYGRQHRWFFALFLATLVVSVSKDLLIAGHWPDRTNLGFHAVFASLCISAIAVRRRSVHRMIGLTGAAGVALYIGLLFMRLR